MFRSTPAICLVSCLALAGACAESSGDNTAQGIALPALPEALERYAVPPAEIPDLLLEDESGHFDIRHVVVTPYRFENETRPCWLTHAGRTVTILPTERERYPVDATHHATIMCAADHMESWADLALDSEAAEAYPGLNAGATIRVRLHPHLRGFRGHPLLSFAGIISGEAIPAENLSILAQVPAGYDFSGSEEAPQAGTVQTCAVWSVGNIEPITPAMRTRRQYALNATHRLTIKCRSVARESFIDLILDISRARAAMRIRRGHRIKVRVLDPEGGVAEFPLVTLEDLLDVEPPPEPALPPEPEPPTPPSDPTEAAAAT